MSVTKARLLDRLRRDDGALSTEYAILTVVGVVIVGVLLAIVRSDAMRAHLTELIMRSPV